MAYQLHGLIGFSIDLKSATQEFTNAMAVSLTKDISLVPMTNALFDEINNFTANGVIGKFEFLTTKVENTILKIFHNTTVAYVEAEYFGGIGAQCGIMWRQGERVFEKELQKDVINEILRDFGVVKNLPMDEFDTVRLGRHRSTDRWLAQA